MHSHTHMLASCIGSCSLTRMALQLFADGDMSKERVEHLKVASAFACLLMVYIQRHAYLEHWLKL